MSKTFEITKRGSEIVVGDVLKGRVYEDGRPEYRFKNHGGFRITRIAPNQRRYEYKALHTQGEFVIEPDELYSVEQHST